MGMTLRKTSSPETPDSAADGASARKKSAAKKSAAKRATTKRKTAKKEPSVPTVYAASLHPKKRVLPEELSNAVRDLEEALNQPVILLVQADRDSSLLGGIYSSVVKLVRKNRRDLACKREPALVIHSSGGVANAAYRLSLWARAMFGKYTAVVPARAMSAATLLTIGAHRIIMGAHAELGPLDVQRWDPGTHTFEAALDEVHSLQHLRDFSLDTVNLTDNFFKALEIGYDTRTMLPQVMDFVARSLEPIYQKIDAVHWSGATRSMKEAQEYAKRLLEPIYGVPLATRISRNLVEEYPTHGVVISPDEARSLGLNVEEGDGAVGAAVDRLFDCIDSSRSAIGKLVPLETQS